MSLRLTFKISLLLAGMAGIPSFSGLLWAVPLPDAPPPQPTSAPLETADVDTDSGWPRTIQTNEQQVTIYQPQVESWKDNRLQERAAVSIQKNSSAQPIYGVVWLSARTEVDKPQGLVKLEDIEVTKVNFPSQKARQSEYLDIFKEEAPSVFRPIALERLQASLAVTQEEERAPSAVVQNTPPKIIFTRVPSTLVLIDGEPVLRESGVENILRVVNTRVLILFDRVHGKAYLWMGDRWLQSSSEQGPFVASTDIPTEVRSSLEKAKQAAVSQNQVDLLDDPKSGVMEALRKGIIPRVYVSTTPAELVQTQGTPQFQPIAQTGILYVQNSNNDIFMDTADQRYYVLISGRWYRASSLESPWAYVPQSSLPKKFAQIPETNPRGDVLASVAGTPQAKEAAISNQIPQTATIDRSQAGAEIHYDGAPQFRPIEGTPLKYAINAQSPVIEVDPNTYYSVQNGVWFSSTDANGPWTVATRVPSIIYSIPPRSPLYYVTYVYVYGYTPRYVYAGYLPGYLGSYLTPEGVVVYGTGYAYNPWIGSVWYGPPVTFGFGVAWGIGFGWGFHFGYFGGYFAGPCVHPWWGPWGWGIAHGWGWAHPGFRGPLAYNQIHLNRANVYRAWSPNVVKSTGGRTTAFAPRSFGANRLARGSNDVYSDRQGNIYRSSGQGWQHYNGSQWSHATAPLRGAGNSSPSFSHPELDREARARAIGENRNHAFQSGESHRDFGRGRFGGNEDSRGRRTARRGR